jgi:triacylglycerol lipase
MIPYDASRESLFHPGRATNFFQAGPLTSDAALCAEMSRLAYVAADADLRAFLARASFSLVTSADVAGSQAFVAARGGDVVLAFRGTESDDPTDLGSDSDVALVDLDGGGHVHRGFLRALDAVWPGVAPAIPAGARVLVTGHSLGAALATLAALRRSGASLFTFGSPRVGDTAFAGRPDHPPHERWVDCADIVTRIPPPGLGYAHTGTLHYLDRAGRHRGGIGDTEIDADRRHAETEYLTKHAFREGTAAMRDLADHAPINYVSGVAGLRGEG